MSFTDAFTFVKLEFDEYNSMRRRGGGRIAHIQYFAIHDYVWYLYEVLTS